MFRYESVFSRKLGKTCTKGKKLVVTVDRRKLNGWDRSGNKKLSSVPFYIAYFVKLLKRIPYSKLLNMNTFAKLAQRQYKEEGVQVRGSEVSYAPTKSLLWPPRCLAHRREAGGENAGINTPSSAGISNLHHPGSPESASGPASACREMTFKGESMENVLLAQVELSGTKHRHFPTPGRTTPLSDESQGCVPESKPNGDQRGCLGNSVRPEEKRASVMV